ncbi:MAG TPA: hypothetical protein VF278_22055 [Pirellulales bacterium]
MKSLTARTIVSTTLLALATAAQADEKSVAGNARRFESLKQLAGQWVEVAKDGKPSDKVVSSIRVTSAGTVVEETLFPGSDHEMVTMYHLDGDDLLLTHYCSLGNQPRLRAEPSDDAKRIIFKFVGATNLKSEDEMHIHQAKFQLDDADHFHAEWTANKDGGECHQVVLDLVRKQK